MNLLILIGIVIIVVGFSLKLDVLAVVLTAGIATGLAAKMNLLDILKIIGKVISLKVTLHESFSEIPRRYARCHAIASPSLSRCTVSVIST